TASGVTLGLAVSVGGIATPLIGALADRIGLEYAVLPLIALPAIAFIALWGLKDPSVRTVKWDEPKKSAASGQQRNRPARVHSGGANPSSTYGERWVVRSGC